MAGVSSGSKLIEAAKAQRLKTQITEIDRAIKTFQLTYDALPGDMDKAEDFWGVYNASTNPTGTVNGDGDGNIGLSETFRAWQHIATKAGILSGSFSGVAGSSGDEITVGTNVPTTPFSGKVLEFKNVGYNLDYGAEVVVSSTERGYGVAFSSKFVYKFDKKYDDGVVNTGEVKMFGAKKLDNSAWESCSYSSLSDDIKCGIVFVLQ